MSTALQVGKPKVIAPNRRSFLVQVRAEVGIGTHRWYSCFGAAGSDFHESVADRAVRFFSVGISCMVPREHFSKQARDFEMGTDLSSGPSPPLVRTTDGKTGHSDRKRVRIHSFGVFDC